MKMKCVRNARKNQSYFFRQQNKFRKMQFALEYNDVWIFGYYGGERKISINQSV